MPPVFLFLRLSFTAMLRDQNVSQLGCSLACLDERESGAERVRAGGWRFAGAR